MTNPQQRMWRVRYHLWVAGGRQITTWREVPAATADEAIQQAKIKQRQDDAARGRANVGSFANAAAYPVEVAA
jgi:hypothetical protein